MKAIKERSLIGLSLSNCVRDLAHGYVKLSDVSYIETGTKIQDEGDWEHVIERYSQTYWQGVESEAKIIVAALRRLELIQQPRLYGAVPPSISKGHWVLAPNRWEE